MLTFDQHLSQRVQENVITYDQALEEAICFGWIDGQVRRRDEWTYFQRFTPRRARSRWSKRNTTLAERLISEGRMQASGIAEVERATADDLPAYVVFHNSTLADIAGRRPSDLSELAAVPGVGPTKLDRYGGDVLRVVAACGEQQVEQDRRVAADAAA